MAGDLGVNPTKSSLPSPVRPVDQFVGFDAWDPGAFLEHAAPNAFRIAAQTEIPVVHRLSEDIMQMRLAPQSAMAAAHRKTGGSAWLHETPMGEGSPAPSGVILMLPLSWDGEAALRTGNFSFYDPPERHLCAPGEELASVYLWLCAGTDRTSRRNIMRTANAWFDGPCSGLRVYGRAASDEGLAAFESFGFRRLSPVRSDIFYLARR